MRKDSDCLEDLNCAGSIICKELCPNYSSKDKDLSWAGG